MTRFALVFAAALATAPAYAEDPKNSPGLGEIAPLMEGLRGLMEGWAQEAMPLMEQLADKMSHLNTYEAPEVLPNGDIIIRRKPVPKGTPDDTPKPNPDGGIDL